MVWEITAEELLVRYGDGERNFAGIELIDSGVPSRHSPWIDLVGIVLRDINLRGAYLREADLTRADLTGADLSGVFLDGCTLAEAIIRDANLRAATLYWSAFGGADLRLRSLDYMNACGSIFRKAYIGTFEGNQNLSLLIWNTLKALRLTDGLLNLMPNNKSLI